jgi:hypothetical protein
MSPAAAVMVDGYFGAGQSVTLTEIRTALHEGVQVYGCTSIGALRAVEARACGMIGVGEIFLSYMTGKRTEDENVALLHDDDFNPLTVPTVNVDALCDLLARQGAPMAECALYQERAAAIHFTDRSYSAMRHIAHQCFSDPSLVLGYLRTENSSPWNAKQLDAEDSISDIVLGCVPPCDDLREIVPVPAAAASLLR